MFANFTLEWPYVILKFESAPQTTQEMDSYLVEFEALLAATLRRKKEKIHFICEIGKVSLFAALPYLSSQVEFIKKIGGNGMVEAIAGTAIIIENDTTRRVIEWVLSRVTLQKPYKACANREAAKKWFGDEVKNRSFE